MITVGGQNLKEKKINSGLRSRVRTASIKSPKIPEKNKVTIQD